METPDFDYDGDAPLELEMRGETVTGDVSVREVAFDNGNGGRTVATLIAPARPNGIGVVLAHGGFDDGRHFFVGEGTGLARHGITALLTAYRLPPHGDPEVVGPAARTAVLTQRRALDVLGAHADRLCYFGHSGGAQFGAILSAVDRRLYALALASGGAGATRRVAAAGLPVDDPYLEFLERFDPVHYVSVPGPRRLLFQHGRHDDQVFLSEGRRLFEAAAGPREWREYDCGHDTTTPPDAKADRLRLYTSG